MSDTPRKPRPNTPSRGPRNPKEEAARLLRSPPVGSAVGDEPPAGIEHVDGGRADGEMPIVGQRLVRQVGPLFDLIRHADTQMPLTAAIYGPWGSGKTTAMRWLDRMLECWRNDGPKLISNKQMTNDQFVDVRTVWFYPWKYQNRDDVLRGIIAEVIRATITVHGADAKTVQDAIRRFGGFLGRSFLSVLDSVELSGKAGVADAKVDLGFAREIAEEFDRTNHPEKAFLNHFEETLCAWTRRTIPRGKRLVVFIDDLDRCLPRIALQVLEALKLYLRVPEVIFVVGVDRDVIARLVDKIYKEDQVEGVDAARYLAKMFQVEVTLDAEEDLAKGFFEHVTRGHHVWDMLKAAPEERLFLREYILHHADRNPREIKRLFNGVMMAAVGELHDEGMADDGDAPRIAMCLLRGAGRFLRRNRLEFLHQGARRDLRENIDEKQKFVLHQAEKRCAACVHAIGKPFFADFCKRLAAGEDHAVIREQKNLEPFLFLLDDEWLDRVLALGGQSSDEIWPKINMPLVLGTVGDFSGQVEVRQTRKPVVIDQPARYRLSILESETEELRTIRDAVALSVNEKPEHLTEAHLLACAEIDLYGTGITDLTPIAGLTELRVLGLVDTGVVDLNPVAGLAKLQQLKLNGTGVVDLAPIAGLKQLSRLFLDGTSVADLTPVVGLTELEWLFLMSTDIQDVTPVAKLRKLKCLSLSGTRVADLTPINALTQLKWLFLSQTGITNLASIDALSGLEMLVLDGTSITDLTPIEGLTKLNVLDLRSTGVVDLVPVGKLTALERLHLDGTGVVDLSPIAGLLELRILDLVQTRVSSLSPIAGFRKLRKLDLRGVHLAEEQVASLREVLPNCSIYT